MTFTPPRPRKNGCKSSAVIVAVIGAVSAIVVAIINLVGKEPTSISTAVPVPVLTKLGSIEGSVVDVYSASIVGVTLTLPNGLSSTTDRQGTYVIKDVPAGPQTVRVTTQDGVLHGKLDQHTMVKSGETSVVNFIYDTKKGTLGLLTISNPIDGGILELHQKSQNNHEYRATIRGLCGSLRDNNTRLAIWVFIRESGVGPLWKQDPAALIDPQKGSWAANALFGEPGNLPQDGDEWEIVAVAAEASSEIARVLNTPQLPLLPAHTSSNVVTVKLRVPRQGNNP